MKEPPLSSIETRSTNIRRPPMSSILIEFISLPGTVLEAIIADLPSWSLRALMLTTLQSTNLSSVRERELLNALLVAVEVVARRQVTSHPAARFLDVPPRRLVKGVYFPDRSAYVPQKHVVTDVDPNFDSALNSLPELPLLDLLEFLERLDCVYAIDLKSGNHYVDDRAEVWSAGRNDAGQGARPGGDVNTLVCTVPILTFTDDTPAAVANIAITTSGGSAYGSGISNISAQNSGTVTYTSRKDCLKDAVVSLAAGDQHSVALTARGVLLVSGANGSGQLGLRDQVNRNGWVPVTDLRSVRTAAVACGGSHTIILTGDGRVWTCGANDQGQLGRSLADACSMAKNILPSRNSAQLRHSDRFGVVEGLSLKNSKWKGGVIQIAAGSSHSVVLVADGRVFATGDNSRGQLGLGVNVSASYVFTNIDCYGHRVVHIGCGPDTTMLLTRDNMVLVTGKRRVGLCVIGGLGSSLVTHLAVGDGFAIARTSKCDLVVSKCRKRFEVTNELTQINAIDVSAGMGHYALVTDTGRAMASGCNAFGQVAAGQMGLTILGGHDARVIRPHRVALTDVQVPEGLLAQRVASGAYHTLYLLRPREALSSAIDQ